MMCLLFSGTGRRRWRVGEKLQMRQHCPHPDLLQVEPFEAIIIDEELSQGHSVYSARFCMKAMRWKTP